jgi:endonuclease-8
VPEGDALHRAAARLQPLVGQRLEVFSPHPRGQVTQVAAQLDGKVLESVEAVGKNLLLHFEDGFVLRSHLRMTGRWSLGPRGAELGGSPWLVLRGDTQEGVLWNGPVLELHTRAVRRLGPDILERPPRIDAMLTRIAASDPARRIGEVLLDQTLVAGVGNMWLAEALWEARLSPWRLLRDVTQDEVRHALETAARLMSAALVGGRPRSRNAYRRAGRACRRCGTAIRSRGQGDANRIAYWCPACQPGEGDGTSRA